MNLQKVYFGIDKALIALLIVFAAVFPVSSHLTDLMMGLTFLLWLIKLCIGGVKFEKSFLNWSILLVVVLIMIHYIALRHVYLEDINQKKLIPPLIWFFLISTTPITKKQFKVMIALMITAMSGLIIYFLFKHLQTPYTALNRLNYWGHPTIFSGFISMFFILLLPLLYDEKKKIYKVFYFLALIIMVFGLLLTFTRGAWISALVGAGVLFFLIPFSSMRNRLITFGLGILILIIPLFSSGFTERLLTTTVNASDNERFMIWRTAVTIIKEHPVFGAGLNMFKVHFSQINHLPYDTSHIHAHNNILQIWAELGMIGLGLFIFMVVNMFRIAWSQLKSTDDTFVQTLGYAFIGCFTTFLVHGLFDFALRMRPSFTFLMLLLGAMISVTSTSSVQNKSETSH